MDAILIAGGIPAPDEPLYKYTQGLPKAMVDVAGKAMIQWVLDALGKTQHVENIILIGLPKDNTLTCAKPLHYVENQGSMLANIVAGIYKVLEIRCPVFCGHFK